MKIVMECSVTILKLLMRTKRNGDTKGLSIVVRVVVSKRFITH